MKITRKTLRESPVARVAITLTRFEGPAEECDIPLTFPTFQAAEECLRGWAATAPEGGAYDKTDVALLIEGGPLDGTPGPLEAHGATFRLDLTREGVPDLRAWLEARTGFYAGHRRPEHLDAKQYAATLARYIRDPDLRAFKLACEALWARLVFLGRQVEGRLKRCASLHMGPCQPFEENPSGLWRCPTCKRLFCLYEGGSDSPVCDSCWAEPKKRAIRTPGWGEERP